jgi:hypothetical protein
MRCALRALHDVTYSTGYEPGRVLWITQDITSDASMQPSAMHRTTAFADPDCGPAGPARPDLTPIELQAAVAELPAVAVSAEIGVISPTSTPPPTLSSGQPATSDSASSSELALIIE